MSLHASVASKESSHHSNSLFFSKEKSGDQHKKEPFFNKREPPVPKETFGGTWVAEEYTLNQDRRGPEKRPKEDGWRGIEIKLKFTPNENVDARAIGLTQTATDVVAGTTLHYPNDTKEKHSVKSDKEDTYENNLSKPDGGQGIDVWENSTSPLYVVNPGSSTALSNGTTSTILGQNGYHYRDDNGKLRENPAILSDGPNLPASFKNSGQTFETTAVALSGNQAGMYYGSVQWGWMTDDKGVHKELPLKPISHQVPSANFMKAAKLWNESTNSENAPTIDLPIVNVMVATKQLNLTASEAGNEILLDVGTRLELLFEDPAFVHCKIVDGPYSNTTGTIPAAQRNNIVKEEQ